MNENQTLNNHLDYNKPSFSFFTTQQTYIHHIPNRITNKTTNINKRRNFVLTLQTHKQHIQHKKTTHNICTTQTLNALTNMIYLNWLNHKKIQELNKLLISHTHYTQKTLTTLNNISTLHNQPVVHKFALQLNTPMHNVIERCTTKNVNPNYPLPNNNLLVAITKQRSKTNINHLTKILGATVATKQKTIATR